MKILAYFIGGLGVIALIVGLALLAAFPLMWMINYLVTPSVLVALFGISKLTFWKTVALSIVSGWLFKGTSTTTSK